MGTLNNRCHTIVVGTIITQLGFSGFRLGGGGKELGPGTTNPCDWKPEHPKDRCPQPQGSGFLGSLLKDREDIISNYRFFGS